MPLVRLTPALRAPSATTAVITSAKTTPSQGFQPEFEPLRPALADRVADHEPGHPEEQQLREGHHPAVTDDRNTIVTAASPRITVRVMTKATKKSEPTSGRRAARAMLRPTATLRGDRCELRHAGFPNSP